jgi:hypothetical protein
MARVANRNQWPVLFGLQLTYYRAGALHSVIRNTHATEKPQIMGRRCVAQPGPCGLRSGMCGATWHCRGSGHRLSRSG